MESDPNRGRSRLNDRERRQAALPILVFGNDMVSMCTTDNKKKTRHWRCLTGWSSGIRLLFGFLSFLLKMKHFEDFDPLRRFFLNNQPLGMAAI